MKKKYGHIFLSICVCALIALMSASTFWVSAAAKKSQADAGTNFTFKGSMSKEVLRSYASRAITMQGFTIENNTVNPLFEEDLRMIRRIGAKYIGRAAFYSWGGNLSDTQIENHYKVAKELAAKAHQADPELILQAGIFEIAYQGTVNSTKIPAYVFEAFGQPVENRRFRWNKIVIPDGNFGIGFWGSGEAGVPDITQLETKMYFYYQITRYIDAGYEAFHMGQAEMMMQYRGNNYAHHWKTVLDKARTYAKTHARRGIALFDSHDAIDSGGIKVGNDLVFDIQAAGMCPNETYYKDGAYQCRLVKYQECWLSWVGRTAGGRHPLGFDMEENFTIIEFDNYGGNGNPGKATYSSFYNWGYDDVTWFATQPEWYRNQFLEKTAQYLSNTVDILDSKGKQQYFLQPVCRRVITPLDQDTIEIAYQPGKDYNLNFVVDYRKSEHGMDYDYKVDYDPTTKQYNTSYVFKMRDNSYYHANRQSDGCPNGFGQEDTIRKIFLGENVKENQELLKVVLPEKYRKPSQAESSSSPTNSSQGTTNQPTVSYPNDTSYPQTEQPTVSYGDTSSHSKLPITSFPSGNGDSDMDQSFPSVSEDTASEDLLGGTIDEDSDLPSKPSTDNGSDPNHGTAQNGQTTPLGDGMVWWIIGIVSVLALAGAGLAVYFLFIKKKNGK